MNIIEEGKKQEDYKVEGQLFSDAVEFSNRLGV